MEQFDWGGFLYFVLISIPLIMLFKADNKLKAMQRAERKAARSQKRNKR
jgi:hypothetical protein